MSELDRNTPIDIPLYRIAPEVKKEIVQAINFWNQHSIIKNSLMVIRAINDLENNYGTTTSTQTNIIGSSNSNNNVDNFLLSKIENGIEAFKNYLKSKKSNNPINSIENKLIDDLLSTYDIAIESVLKNKGN